MFNWNKKIHRDLFTISAKMSEERKRSMRFNKPISCFSENEMLAILPDDLYLPEN